MSLDLNWIREKLKKIEESYNDDDIYHPGRYGSDLLQHAPNDIAALIAEVERLRSDIDATTARNAALTTEVERLRGELAGFRRYLTRSIADDIAGEAEAWEILDGISNEDYALIDRWTAAMENPAYAASDAARLRKDVWDLSEANISLDRNLKDCVAWLGALESVILVDLNALRLEPDRAAAIETVRRAVEDWGTDDRSP